MSQVRERIRERKPVLQPGGLSMQEEALLERIHTLDIPSLPIHILRTIEKGIKPTFAFMMYYDRANKKFRFQEEAISSGGGGDAWPVGANSAQTEHAIGGVWTQILAPRANRVGLMVVHITDSSDISISFNASGAFSYRKLPEVMFKLINYTGGLWGTNNTYRVVEWW